jgi:Fe-S cluster assembly protein SufD
VQQLDLEKYFETVFDPKESHQAFRKKAWDRFLELGLPRPKQEAFQYFPLEKLQIPLPATLPQNAGLLAAPHSLLFADGYFQSANLPSPLVCLKWDAAMLVYGVFLQNRFSRSLKEETDPIAAMNGAFQGKGAFLYVPPQTQLEEPIEIHHHTATGLMASPRLQIVLGVGAKVQIVQRAFGMNEAFCNAHIDVSLDAGAALAFVDARHWPERTTSFQSFRSTLKRDSQLQILSLSKGAKLSRSSIKVQLLEENGEALLQGLSVLDADLESHTHVLVEHIAPHCRSRQHYKGILRGKSRSSFEGKILVRPLAQKTEAYQLCNTLLLSDEAKGVAKPNLEIFADDVKASHGATLSQFNVEELFYLRSRGLDRALAEETLAAGFCQEILNAVPRGISL